jgi:hypothetical protein
LKKIKREDLYVGQLVVVTEHPHTQVYTVAEIGKHIAILQWYEGSMLCSCGHDVHSFIEPSITQIENSIKLNGPLVSLKEIVDWM